MRCKTTETDRSDILFGSPYRSRRFADVVRVCGLGPDLATLEEGERTIIGERGISLSGGQQSRVALARAIYSEARVLLLDDPLAAVDAHLASSIFNECLRGPLCRDRTVILVTHHVQLCRSGASFIVGIEDGTVSGQETLEPTAQVVEDPLLIGDDDAVDDRAAKKFIEDEERAEGRVATRVYVDYLKHVPLTFWILAIGALVLEKVFTYGETLVIRFWGESATSRLMLLGLEHLDYRTSRILPQSDDPKAWLLLYLSVYLVHALFSITNASALMFGTWFAARRYFEELLRSIASSTYRWLDKTPRGRVLNRLSKDTEQIDDSIGWSFLYVADITAEIVLSIIVVVALEPWTIIAVALVAVIYVQVCRFSDAS